MSKKVLILSSSPRRGGNSDTLCDEFLRGAQEAGHEVEKIFLKDKTIHYCTGCGVCNEFPDIILRIKTSFGSFFSLPGILPLSIVFLSFYSPCSYLSKKGILLYLQTPAIAVDKMQVKFIELYHRHSVHHS